MSVGFVFIQERYVRQEHIAEDNLGEVHDGNRDDPPEDVSETLMDRRPP